MAHMVETMAYAGEVPWHGLGFKVSNDLTPMEMMEASKTNWEVRKEPAVVLINGEYISTGRQALIRSTDNHILDVISDDWNPTQNITAFEFFREYTEAGQMQMETAGSLDDGRVVWALAKMNQAFEAVRDDVVQGYLLFSNPHKYGRAITVRFTPIRVVCNNTLTYALNDKMRDDMSVSVNHRNIFNPQVVKQTLQIATAKLDQYKEAAEFLATKRYTSEKLTEYMKAVFPKATYERKTDRKSSNDNDDMSRPARQALAVVDTQPGADLAGGTWWNAFNAVTFATDHLLGRSVDSRLHSSWFGVNQGRKLSAMAKAVQFAEAA